MKTIEVFPNSVSVSEDGNRNKTVIPKRAFRWEPHGNGFRVFDKESNSSVNLELGDFEGPTGVITTEQSGIDLLDTLVGGFKLGGDGVPLTKTAVESLGFVDQTQTEQIAATAAANAVLTPEKQQEVVDSILVSDELSNSIENNVLEVSKLKADLVEGKNKFNKNDIDVVLDAFMNASGIESASTVYNISGYVKVNPNTLYTANFGMRFHAFFDSEKNVISGGSNSQVNSFTTSDTAEYVRLSIAKTIFENFMLVEGSELGGFSPFKSFLDPNQFEGDEPIFRKVSDRIKVTETDFIKRKKNLFDKNKRQESTQIFANGSVSNTDTYDATDFIEVIEGSLYSLSHEFRFLAFYTNDKIITTGGSNTPVTSFSVPNGVKYIKGTVNKNFIDLFQMEEGDSPTSYEPFYMEVENLFVPPVSVESTWKDVKFGAIGDSVTAQSEWFPKLIEKTGIDITSYGVGGTRISGDSADSINNNTRINAIPLEEQVILLNGGINDFAQNVPLGTQDLNNTDINTFNGAVNETIRKLLLRFNGLNKRLVVIGTSYGEFINRAGFVDDKTNQIGLTSLDYSKSMEYYSKQWGVPFIDLNSLCGFNEFNIGNYMKEDGARVHPNSVGGNIIGSVISGFLKTIEP